MFISFVGYDPNNNQPGNIYIKTHYPTLHANMEVIGLRSASIESHPELKDEILKRQFLTYVIYFLLSIYLSSYYREQRSVS